MRRILTGPLLILVVAGVLCADVTVRYSMSTIPGEALPAAAAQQLSEQMKGFAGATTLQIKGNKARSTGMGGTSITDFDKGVITLLDESGKRFVTASQKEFLDAIGSRVPKQTEGADAAGAGVEMNTAARKTERTREIRGIRAEETELVLKAQVTGMPFEMRTVMSVWSAAPGEADRHSALRELASYSQRAWAGPDVNATLKTMLGQLPGAGAGIAALINTMKDAGFLLEMKGTIAMPGLAEVLRRANPAAAPAAGGDDVMFTMTQKLEELSTPELPESLFSVPRDYTAVDLKELIERWLPKVR
jgi:hypothetical protein